MNDIYALLERTRKKKPLIHHITNWVSIYDCANVTRCVGALPVMAHAIEESSDMTGISQALVLNIGTLTPDIVKSMISSGKKANELGIPIVLDVVGAGATRLRTEKAREILENVRIDILKGNSSEIGTLAGAKSEVKGVEAIKVEGDLIDIGKDLAKKYNSTIVITGKEDIVTDGKRVFLISNGHKMMGRIVGTGCMASSVIGSFAGVEKDFTKASAYALACFGIAGELAAREAKGPGTYKERFYDELYNLDENKIKSLQKVRMIK
jgi:hydroxyethylthiazole kinase